MNEQQILEALRRAQTAMVEALGELKTVADNHGYVAEDARYYANELAELITTDHGQAGLQALINIVNVKVND